MFCLFLFVAVVVQEMALFSHFRPEANAGGMEDARRLQSELKLTRSQLECLEAESMELNAELVESRRHNELLAADVERNRKDQEDLLVLLADQDSSIQKYKDRLRNLNQSVSFKQIHLKSFINNQIINQSLNNQLIINYLIMIR